MRGRPGKVLFLGPIAKVYDGAGKTSFAFTMLQAGGQQVQLEYPSLQAAGAARGELAGIDNTVIVTNARVFAAIADGLLEARSIGMAESLKAAADEAKALDDL